MLKLHSVQFVAESPEAIDIVLQAFISPFPSLSGVTVSAAAAAMQGRTTELECILRTASADDEWPARAYLVDRRKYCLAPSGWGREFEVTAPSALRLIPYVGDRWLDIEPYNAQDWLLTATYDRPSLSAAGDIIRLILSPPEGIRVVADPVWAYRPEQEYTYQNGNQHVSDPVPPEIRARWQTV